ncbi:MAG: tryptophan--tRNA ligase [Dehalococcoidia bacterium]|nr:tryptophan--tRNA ligase [Dehalococcoidia bacterium]
MAKRVFSGARPTGRQHIGNYFGHILNLIALQEEYDCFDCVVDLHALTTLESTATLQQDVNDMVIDWLAAGVDPEKSVVFVQSHVPEIAELHLLLSMVTPLNWLLRVPTFKDKVKMHPENVNYGLVGYPVLMTSDIVLYKGEVVPVGEDQLPHLELAREIVRRFNSMFGDVFPEPQAKLTEFPMIVGLDGSGKMSKSAENYLEISSTPDEIRRRISTAFTDPARKRRTDPGHPEVCNVFSLHKMFTPRRVVEIETECRGAGIGCVDCKKLLAQGVVDYFGPLRERREALVREPEYVRNVVADGARRAAVVARQTLEEVKSAMNLKS